MTPLRNLSSSDRKLPGLLRGRADDVRSFLDSLAKQDDLKDCYIRDLLPALLLHRVYLKAGYTGPPARICDGHSVGCLRAMAYPRRELDGITISVEESLRTIGWPVAPATDAADVARYRGSLFDTMCKFVAEPGPAEFFTIWR